MMHFRTQQTFSGQKLERINKIHLYTNDRFVYTLVMGEENSLQGPRVVGAKHENGKYTSTIILEDQIIRQVRYKFDNNQNCCGIEFIDNQGGKVFSWEGVDGYW